MRLITVCILSGSLFSLCGCSKENTTPTPIAARETNIFGFPAGTEKCKPSKLVRQSSSASETTVFTYNIYGLIGNIAKTGGTDNFVYDASNKLTTITDAGGGNWRFIYNSNAGKRAGAIYHAYQFNGSGVKDTLAITYPAARTLVMSVRHPFADSMFRDTILLNSDYNPISFKRVRQGNGNDSTSTFIMEVNYAYGSALNSLTAEAALWAWVMPLYKDMRLLLFNPAAIDRNFTFYFPEIIPFGNNLQQSYTYTGVGVGSFTGTISSAVTNSNNYPVSFTYDADGESATYTFDYTCQ